MLREVHVEVDGGKGLAVGRGCCAELLRCADLEGEGKALLLQLDGEGGPAFLSEVKARRDARRAYLTKLSRDRLLCLLEMDKPLYCRVAELTGALCLSCPLIDTIHGRPWRLIVKRSTSLPRILALLELGGVRARVTEQRRPFGAARLTKRQAEILAYAWREGLLDFPRRKSITAAARELRIKPSTLSEILRVAQRKVVEHYLGFRAGDNAVPP